MKISILSVAEIHVLMRAFDILEMIFLAASRMVDHWISKQRAQSGTSSPVRDAELSSPLPAKKKLKIQTVVSEDKPQTISSQKTLSER